jgi:heat shock 70kDa protein 1/2/6/8
MAVDKPNRYKAEDELAMQRTQAKNQLESYCYSVRNTLQDSKLGSKLEVKDKTAIERAVTAALQWLESNPSATKVAIEQKQKELEDTCNPIIAKVYQQTGDSGSNGGVAFQPAASSGGPKVEEVD